MVEDDDAVRAMVQRSLETYGYEVLSASSADEAEGILSQRDGEVSLLLTDVVMPVRGGRELYDRLAGSHPALKVLFMSGYRGNGAVRYDRGVPDVPFIPKPFAPDALACKVRRILDAGNVSSSSVDCSTMTSL